MSYATIVPAVLIAIAVGLMAFRALSRQTVTERSVKAAARATNEFTEDIESRMDRYVAESQHMWQHVRSMPVFWAGVFLSTLSIIMNVAGAYGLALGMQGTSFVVMAAVLFMLFTAADIALPAVTMTSDRGAGEWYEFRSTDRSHGEWGVMVICLLMQFIVVWVATSETSSLTEARNDIGALNYKSSAARVRQINAQLEAMPVEPLKAADLKQQADEKEKAAMIESHRQNRSSPADPTVTTWGKYCKGLCLQARAEVEDLRKRQGIAASREKLLAERSQLTTELSESGNARSEGARWAANIEAVSGGAVSEQAARSSLMTIIGMILIVLMALVWMTAADRLGERRLGEYRRRGIAMDRERATTYGLPPKYVIEPPKAQLVQIEPPTITDRIEIHHISADEIAKRFANDPHIKAIYQLFGTVIVPISGENVDIEELQRAYKIAELKADPNASPATLPAFRSALGRIILARDDIQLSAGKIIGWQFADRVPMETAQEAAE